MKNLINEIYMNIEKDIEEKQDTLNQTRADYVNFRDVLEAEALHNLVVLFRCVNNNVVAAHLAQWAELNHLGEFVNFQAMGMGLDHLGGYYGTKNRDEIIPEFLELCQLMGIEDLSKALGGWIGPKKLYAFSVYMLNRLDGGLLKGK